MVVASQLVAKVSTQGVDTSKRELQSMGETVKETSGGFKSMLGNALSMAAGQAIFNMVGQAVGYLKNQVTDSIQAAIEHQDIMAQTAKVLKSTGDASGMTQQSLEDLATSLEKTTYFSKDQTEAGENLLLTFTGIGKDVFPQTTKVMLDMSRAMGQDVKSSAIQLGKALNDPSQGLTALTRVGVTFTDQQKQQIQTMQDAGDVAGAQKIILAELNREFGGSADATTTAAGRMQIFKDRIEDLKERIASGLLPILDGLIEHVASPALDAAEGLFHNLGNAASYVGNVLKTVHMQDFDAALQSVKSTIQPLINDFSNLAASLHPVSTDFDPLADKIQSLAQGGLNLLTGALNNVYVGLSAVDGLFHGGKGPLEDFVNTLKPFGPDLQNIAGLLGGQFQQAFTFASNSAKQLGDWFRTSVAPALKDAMPGFLSLAHVLLENVVPAVIRIRGEAQQFIEHVISKFGPILGQIIPPLIRFAGILAKDVAEGLKFIMPYVEQAAKAIGQFADEIIDRVAPIIKNFIDGLTPIIQQFMASWAKNWPVISEVLKSVWDEMVGIIKIAWSLVSGIILIGLDLVSGNWKQAWTDLQNMLGGIWDGVKQVVQGGIEQVQAIMMGIDAMVGTHLVKPFQNALGTIGGVFNNIGKLVSDVTSANWGAIPGDAHALGFAGGTSFAPGGFAMVGEQGPELMYVPRGAQIYPASQTQQMLSGGSASGGAGQPIVLVMDGRAVGYGVLPHITSGLRLHTGVRI
jgi:phage-related protein